MTVLDVSYFTLFQSISVTSHPSQYCPCAGARAPPRDLASVSVYHTMGGYISILLLIAIAAICYGQYDAYNDYDVRNNHCRRLCVKICREDDWRNIPGGGMCCAGNRNRGVRSQECRDGECDMRREGGSKLDGSEPYK